MYGRGLSFFIWKVIYFTFMLTRLTILLLLLSLLLLLLLLLLLFNDDLKENGDNKM